MHGPLFTLAEIARNSPPARIIHSISTGYAGLLGAMLRFVRKRPYVLTEHGIYTKERKIDLAHAEWIKDAREAFGGGLDDDVSYIRRLWIRFFEGLGRMAYAAADKIIALYEGNRRRQVLRRGGGGAHRRHPQRHRPRALRGPAQQAGAARRLHQGPAADAPPQVLGLLGRVVPIKDIRTFVRAMRTVCTRLPEAEGWIIGPEDEDQAYARECRELATNLGLGDRVKFLGFQKPDDILPKLGLMVLTSISEALPLVLLEGYAAGAAHGGHRRGLLPGAGRGGRPPRTRPWATRAPSCPSPIRRPPPRRPSSCSAIRSPGRRPRPRASPGWSSFYTQKMMYDAYRKIYRDALEGKLGRDRVRAA